MLEAARPAIASVERGIIDIEAAMAPARRMRAYPTRQRSLPGLKLAATRATRFRNSGAAYASCF